MQSSNNISVVIEVYNFNFLRLGLYTKFLLHNKTLEKVIECCRITCLIIIRIMYYSYHKTYF